MRELQVQIIVPVVVEHQQDWRPPERPRLSRGNWTAIAAVGLIVYLANHPATMKYEAIAVVVPPPPPPPVVVERPPVSQPVVIPRRATLVTPTPVRPRRRVLTNSELEASLIKQVEPIYPEQARRERISGTIQFHAVIGTDGLLHNIEPGQGDPLLVEAATDALLQWRYKPHIEDGRPIEVEADIRVIFKLKEQP